MSREIFPALSRIIFWLQNYILTILYTFFIQNVNLSFYISLGRNISLNLFLFVEVKRV